MLCASFSPWSCNRSQICDRWNGTKTYFFEYKFYGANDHFTDAPYSIFMNTISTFDGRYTDNTLSAKGCRKRIKVKK
jgi:hypothetical protein